MRDVACKLASISPWRVLEWACASSFWLVGLLPLSPFPLPLPEELPTALRSASLLFAGMPLRMAGLSLMLLSLLLSETASFVTGAGGGT